MKRIPAAIAAIVLGLIVTGIPALPAVASTSHADEVYSLEFESFAAQYLLHRDAEGLSSMHVVETIVALYPEANVNRGFYRDIPKFNQERPLNPTVISVTDGAGNDVPYTVEDYDAGDGLDLQYTAIALGDDSYVHGRKTYVIEYTLDNVVTHFEDENSAEPGIDELYWDVNGTDTGVGIGEVSVTVTIDDDLVPALTGDRACYPGYAAAEQGCELAQSSDGATFSTSVATMAAYDTLTISIGFVDGTFVQAPTLSEHWLFAQLPKALFWFSLLVVLLAAVIRFGFWRDNRGRGIIVPQYTAPEDNDLLLAADVIGKGHEALAAAFVGLAVGGFVNVVDLKPGATSDVDRFALEFRTLEGASPQQTKLLKALFDHFDQPGERAILGSLSATDGAELYSMGLRARDRAVNAGLRAKPSSAVSTWIMRTLWLVLLGFGLSLGWSFWVGIDAGPVFGWLAGSLVAYFVAGRLLAKPYLLTAKGAELRDYLRGMRDYLTLAEEDRLRVLQSPSGADRVSTADATQIVKLHEKLLPYAVLWDVEKEWSEVLQVEYQAAAVQPEWINSDLRHVNLGGTLSSFTSTSTSRVQPIVTVSSSSGGSSWSGGSSSFSSGSSGGGFSGGGGGGGGMRGR